MKQLKMLLLASIVTLFTTYGHAVPVNMAPIISYLLSDTQQLSLSGQTKYFATTLGATGSRTYAEDGTYTGNITLADGTTFATTGTYDIVSNIVTLNRTSPAEATLVLTYLGEVAGGLEFNVVVNGGEPFQSISFDTEAERDIYVAEFLSTLIAGQTKYFATTLGVTGFRTYAEDGTYTGSITLADGTTFSTSGTYDIVDYVMTLNRESPAAVTLVLTYLGEVAGGLEFNVVVNGGEPFQSISFATEAERDIYVAEFLSTSFVSDVMPIFEGNCISCHSTSSSRTFKVGDAAYTYDNIITYGLINTTSPDLSLILIRGNGGGHSRGDKLSDVNSKIVRDWIEQGGLDN